MTYEEFENRYQYDPQRDFLARGGFGAVYKAYDTVRKRYVAIKEAGVDFTHKFSLQREVELSHEIEPHPNIVRYINSYRFSIGRRSTDYAVMPYFEHGNLNQVLAKYTLTNANRLSIMDGLLRGVAHLHRQGIIHRDLKASNILMEQRDGQWIPKLTDFGISKLADTEASVSNTQIGLSIHYAAPEQLRNESILPNVDLWAVGVSLYKMVVGVLPFDPSPNRNNPQIPRNEIDTTAVATLINRGLTPEQVARLPYPFRPIIEQCLIVDRHQRVKSADELLNLLEELRVEPLDEPEETIDEVLIEQEPDDFDGPTMMRRVDIPTVPELTDEEIAPIRLSLRRLSATDVNLTVMLNLTGASRFPLLLSGSVGNADAQPVEPISSQLVEQNGEILLDAPYPSNLSVGTIQFTLSWPLTERNAPAGSGLEQLLVETDWYDWQRPGQQQPVPAPAPIAREVGRDNTGPTLQPGLRESLPKLIRAKPWIAAVAFLVGCIIYIAVDWLSSQAVAKRTEQPQPRSQVVKPVTNRVTAVGPYQNGIAEIRTADGRRQYRAAGGRQFDEIRSAQCGLIPVRSGGRWGYLNGNGEMVIDLIFDDAQPFDSTTCTAQVKADGSSYLIDNQGQAIK